MISDKNQKMSKIQQQRNQMMKQKEDQIGNALNTLKSNQKFIKLVNFALTSLDSFVSPPNREIKTNAKIIIRMDGVQVLKTAAIININNEEIVTVITIVI